MTGPLGSHPHRPNWQPATTAEDYLRNCHEGLESYSERRMANLMGVSRAHLWRMTLIAELPDDLFERLLAERRAPGRMPSLKALANIALALRGNMNPEAEHCPHCGGLLRLRARISAKTSRVVVQWLKDTGQSQGPDMPSP